MDVASQHNRFRTLFLGVVEDRKRLFPDEVSGDWMVRCFDSCEEFAARFPDRAACEALLRKWEREAQQTRREVGDTIARIRREGISEVDEDILRYDLPAPE